MSTDNQPRWRPGRDHVESWFWRANHPQEPRAFWLKATILAHRSGPATAQAWACTFDGDRTWGGRVTVPMEQAVFGHQLRLGGCVFDLDTGRARGSIHNDTGGASWDLRWADSGGSMSRPLSLAPHRALVDGPFPKNKVLTPSPVLRFAGSLRSGEATWPVDGWQGMQGHNWGPSHARDYAWGQCIFLDDTEPFCVVEGFSARLDVAGRTTPTISALVIRRGEQTLRFDRLIDLWRQRADVGMDHWTLKMRGGDGVAVLQMRADPRRVICLGYENPDGNTAYCFNSKLAQVDLRVNPARGPSFECHSPHGGALELLRDRPDPRYPVV